MKNAHYLLVTLLLCNAAAMEALPIVLDKLVHEVVAILISVTAVLFFGELRGANLLHLLSGLPR